MPLSPSWGWRVVPPIWNEAPDSEMGYHIGTASPPHLTPLTSDPTPHLHMAPVPTPAFIQPPLVWPHSLHPFPSGSCSCLATPYPVPPPAPHLVPILSNPHPKSPSGPTPVWSPPQAPSGVTPVRFPPKAPIWPHYCMAHPCLPSGPCFCLPQPLSGPCSHLASPP